MEDIFKILLVVGFILFGIAKQSKKGTANEKTGNGNPIPMPEESSMPQDFEPVPESYPSYEGYIPQEKKQETVQKATLSDIPKKKKEQTASKQPNPTATPVSKETDENSDFGIHSIEDARKAIIWSEILHRKY